MSCSAFRQAGELEKDELSYGHGRKLLRFFEGSTRASHPLRGSSLPTMKCVQDNVLADRELRPVQLLMPPSAPAISPYLTHSCHP